MPRPMTATPKRLPLTISIMRLMPRPSGRAGSPLAGDASEDRVTYAHRRVALDDVGRAGRHPHGADQRGLGLTHEVVHSGGDHGGHRSSSGAFHRRVPGTYELGLVRQPPGVVLNLV